MRTTWCAAVLAIMVAGIVLPASAAKAAAPEGVSPGGVDRSPAIKGRCPSFSWGAVDDAAFYEVLAYRLPEGVDLAALADVDLSVAEEVLYKQVAGKATAWTPELERCFIPGNSYIWFVRAVFEEDETAAATDWSQGLFFSVAAAPSAQEVQQARGVLQRYLEEGGGGSEQLAALLSNTGADTSAARRSRGAGISKLAGWALPGSAAIRGEQVDPAGETYGVYGVTSSSTGGSFGVAGEATAATGEVFGVGGVTASADGAGVFAFNAAGGTDLILGADEASAHLTELGITRSVPGPATFDVTNSDGAGAMTLRVDGVDVVTTATDQDALGGLSCASGEVAKWNGSAWGCAADLDTVDALVCAIGEVAKWDGSAWGCAPDLDSSALGLRGSRVWLLPYWYQGPTNVHFTLVNISVLGSAGTFVSCRWFENGTPVLEQLDVWVSLGGNRSFNTQALQGGFSQGWMVVESDEPVFAVANIEYTVLDTVGRSARDRNAPMIPIDCSSPQGYEFVCAQLAE